MLPKVRRGSRIRQPSIQLVTQSVHEWSGLAGASRHRMEATLEFLVRLTPQIRSGTGIRIEFSLYYPLLHLDVSQLSARFTDNSTEDQYSAQCKPTTKALILLIALIALIARLSQDSDLSFRPYERLLAA